MSLMSLARLISDCYPFLSTVSGHALAATTVFTSLDEAILACLIGMNAVGCYLAFKY
jgi:hypothetical protein